ncbi:protein rep [Lysinibacillus sp. NPDC093190]|uniref:protein rep n=1 Tax=Lysinibacillus sp. NPDC093190 TaxID=3390575 RepID=UPI003CFC3D28
MNYTSSSNKKEPEWTSLWQNAMILDYTPVVRVQVVRNLRKKEVASHLPAGMVSAVQETRKYSVKDADYLTGDFDDNLSL